MKKNFVFAIMALAVALLATGCVSTFGEVKTMKDGGQATFLSMKDPAGQDVGMIYYQPPVIGTQVPVQQTLVPAQAPIVPARTSTRIYTRTEDSYEQGCPSPKQRRNIRHRETTERLVETIPPQGVPVVNQPVTTTVMQTVPFVPPAVSYGGSGPGFFKAVLPAAFIGGGMVGAAAALRPSNINNAGGAGGKSFSTSNSNSTSTATVNDKIKIGNR